MAQEWEMAMGLDFGMGMGMGASFSTSTSPPAVAPFASMASSPAYLYGLPITEPLRIDDLIDFSNNDLFLASAVSTNTTATNADSQFFAPKEQSSFAGSRPVSGDQAMSSSSDFQSQQSSFDLYNIPCEEAAELEWLSKFVDDSFSDVPNYQSTCLIPAAGTESTQLRADQPIVTGRGARSKRSRATSGAAAAAAWASALIPPPPNQSSPSSSSSSSSSDIPPPTPKFGIASNNSRSSNATAHNGGRGKKGEGGVAGEVVMEGGVRRCTHCASEKTPQWRTGPMGPKTLCNACGVRYKSGRLVQEYRPAASPTFVLTQHSNSHRKVMELRRQKELLLLNNATAAASASTSAATTARPELLYSDHHYGVC